MPHLSVIVPVYGCSNCLEDLYDRLVKSLNSINKDFEIIFINDCSPDDSWDRIVYLCGKDNRVKGVNLSRNFGQHYAITAGFDYASGEWVICMDCDLQDLPEEISNLYIKAQEGYDIVYAMSEYRSNKGVINNLPRKIYFKLQDILTQNQFKTSNLSFYIMRKVVRDSITKYRESSRQIALLIREQGFSIVGVEVEHADREDGKSSYSLWKRIKLAYEGLVTYPSLILKLAFLLGFTISICSFLGGGYIIIDKLINNSSLPGWASLMTAILFSTGLILTFIGIVGMYIEKIFLEVKNRPLYIVKESINCKC